VHGVCRAHNMLAAIKPLLVPPHVAGTCVCLGAHLQLWGWEARHVRDAEVVVPPAVWGPMWVFCKHYRAKAAVACQYGRIALQ
jgi:hypothetical protein